MPRQAPPTEPDGDPALGDRLPVRAAGRAAAQGAVAAARRLGRCRRPRRVLLRLVLRPLQYRHQLHDGGARQPRALHPAAADHGRRRPARHRAADGAQIGGCAHRHVRRPRGAVVRLVEFLVGPLPPGTPVNLADALVAPDVLRPFLANWAEVVRYFVRSVADDARRRRQRGDECPARQAARLQGRALRDENAGDGAGTRAGAAHALPQGQDVARPVHDHRHAWGHCRT